MATRSDFTANLVNTYKVKRADLHYALVRKVEAENAARAKAYTSTPEWVALTDLTKKLLGKDRAAGLGANLEARGYANKETWKIVGLQEGPAPYINSKLDTLLLGALITTKIKFWDNWFAPVNDYLDAIEAATTNEEIDAAVMALVRAL